ncbi:MAG: hypothetical protein IJK72_00960 [Mycoplasma sp.]|nr:hypothetical protein [Mycoplasma sp.]
MKKNNLVDDEHRIKRINEDINSEWVQYILNFIYDNEINDFDIFFENLFDETITILEKDNQNGNSYKHPVIKKMYELLKNFYKNKPNIKKEINDFEKEFSHNIEENNK